MDSLALHNCECGRAWNPLVLDKCPACGRGKDGQPPPSQGRSHHEESTVMDPPKSTSSPVAQPRGPLINQRAQWLVFDPVPERHVLQSLQKEAKSKKRKQVARCLSFVDDQVMRGPFTPGRMGYVGRVFWEELNRSDLDWLGQRLGGAIQMVDDTTAMEEKETSKLREQAEASRSVRDALITMLTDVDAAEAKFVVDGPLSGAVISLCREIPDDDLRAVVIGEDMSTGTGFFGSGTTGVLVVTDRSVGLISIKGYFREPLDTVRSAKLWTENGIVVKVGKELPGFKIELREVKGSHPVGWIAAYIASHGAVDNLTPRDRSLDVVSRGEVRYLGGDFTGNTRRSAGGQVPHRALGEGAVIEVCLRADDTVILQTKPPYLEEIANYRVVADAIAVLSSNELTHPALVTWLDGGSGVVGGSTGPVAGLALTLRSTPGTSPVLLVSDGSDLGAFAFATTQVASDIVARRHERGVGPGSFESQSERKEAPMQSAAQPEVASPVQVAPPDEATAPAVNIPPPPPKPAGWYTSPNGIGHSYWDGNKWTGDTAP